MGSKKKKKQETFKKVKLKVGKKVAKPSLTDTNFKTAKLKIVSRLVPNDDQTASTSTKADSANIGVN